MNVHVRSFDGRFAVYLYAGPIRVTLWRSHLFHRRRGGCLGGIVGVIFDVIVLAIIFGACFVAGIWLWHLVGPEIFG